MLKKFLVFFTVLAIVYPIFAAAEVWKQSQIGGCYGTWTKESGTEPGPLFFNGVEDCHGTIDTFDLRIFIVNNTDSSERTVFAERKHTSHQGVDCIYDATLLDDEMNGYFYCAKNTPVNPWWNAYIVDSDEDQQFPPNKKLHIKSGP